MPPLSTDNLATLIQRKRELLSQLLAVGVRQGELIDGSQITDLLKLLAAKQQLITALTQTERLLDPFRGENPDHRVWSTPADREACSADAKTCETLYQQVVTLEQQHESQLVARRDSVAEQLREAQSAHQVRRAYQSHHRPASPHHTGAPSPLTSMATQPGALDLTSGT